MSSKSGNGNGSRTDLPDSVDLERVLDEQGFTPEIAEIDLDEVKTGSVGRDPAPIPDPGEVEVPPGLRAEIERAMTKYPRVESASIPALWAIQRKYGWCSPEGIQQAASVLGVTPGYLESVASFYDLFHTQPTGQHQVLVCTNISCWLRGADPMLAEMCEAAGTEPGEVSEDGKLFVRGFECLGACDLAPMASIDGEYFGPLKPGEGAEAIEQLREGSKVLPARKLAGRGAAGGKRSGADRRTSSHSLNKTVPKKRSAAKSRSGKKS